MPNALPTLNSCLFPASHVFSFNGLFSPAMELTDFLSLYQCAFSHLCSLFQPHILHYYFFLFKIPNLGPNSESVHELFPTPLLHKDIKINENKPSY